MIINQNNIKICSICKESKSTNEFHKGDRRCKNCKKQQYIANRVKILERTSQRTNTPEHKQKKKIYDIKYRKSYLGRKRELYRKYMTNPIFRIQKNLRVRLYDTVIRHEGYVKKQKTMTFLGCTMEQFITYIESKFLPGMTWENYGKHLNNWCMDHIKPCASFDLSKEEEQRKCFHYTNLQPLWAKDNYAKGDKIL